MEMASHVGHCIEYNLVCEIEAAQAEASELVSEISGTPTLKHLLVTEQSILPI